MISVRMEKGETMSKYYKAEDVIKAYNEAVQELVEAEMKEFDLGDFTECSFNTTQLKLIPRKIESLPTIEASEDCIDKYSALAELDPRSYEYKAVRELPSVIPQAKEGEWIISADGESSCSVCGASEEEFIYGTENWYGMGESKFCPACGAKTRG